MQRLLVILFVVVFSFLSLSCNKTCTCKTYRNGVMTGEATSDMPDGISSCSDMDVYVETGNGVVSETKCN